MNTSNNKPVFSIGEAARITGVTVKQLRHWENREYIPELTRVLSGERSYRKFYSHDLQIISQIKAYIDEGYTVKTAAGKVRKEFNY